MKLPHLPTAPKARVASFIQAHKRPLRYVIAFILSLGITIGVVWYENSPSPAVPADPGRSSQVAPEGSAPVPPPPPGTNSGAPDAPHASTSSSPASPVPPPTTAAVQPPSLSRRSTTCCRIRRHSSSLSNSHRRRKSSTLRCAMVQTFGCSLQTNSI